MAAIDGECRRAGTKLLYFLSSSDDDASVETAQRWGFRMVDVRVMLEWPVAALPRVLESGPAIRGHRSPDLDALRTIARSSFKDSRYYHDPGFSREQCDSLYEEWIMRDCAGRAEKVLVAETPLGVAGFLTCHSPGAADGGRIGLVGVAEAARGSGVGRALIRAAQAWFEGVGAKRVLVTTQARNTGAQRAYQRAGFVTASAEIWFHKWFD
jgi:dTDP-4-amino-4,6-dideoxy-D-galactose acyltransferase